MFRAVAATAVVTDAVPSTGVAAAAEGGRPWGAVHNQPAAATTIGEMEAVEKQDYLYDVISSEVRVKTIASALTTVGHISCSLAQVCTGDISTLLFTPTDEFIGQWCIPCVGTYRRKTI